MSQEEAAGIKRRQEIEKVTNQIAYYDDLIANYLDVIEKLNGSDAAPADRPDEVKSLIQLSTESIDYCEDKRAILISYLNTLNEK